MTHHLPEWKNHLTSVICYRVTTALTPEDQTRVSNPVYVSIIYGITVWVAQCTLTSCSKPGYLNSCRFMQDEDPKPTSKMGCVFLERNKMTWWKTQCHSMNKKIFQREVKPKIKDESVDGMLEL